MRAVYEATYAIPELGVEPGDRIVVRASHPTAPLAVVKRYGHQTLVQLMGAGHMDALSVLHSEPSVMPCPPPAPLQPSTVAPHLTLV